MPHAVCRVLAEAYAWIVTRLVTALLRGRRSERCARALLPPVGPSTAANDWTRPDVDASEIDFDGVLHGDVVDAATRESLAVAWREDGRAAHAAVAGFARLALDLIALGAPPTLVAAAQRSALDEIRHAELCFALARAIDGKSESPSAFAAAARVRPRSRLRTVALSELAVDSLLDLALDAGAAARVAAKLARRAVDDSVRAILRGISADEDRHRGLGWDVVRFCLREGGAPVARALACAMQAAPSRAEGRRPRDAAAGGWERWGIASAALETREQRAACAAVRRRVLALVAPYGVTAAA